MSLKKIVEAEGRSFIQSPVGQIDTGVQKTTFVAICKVASIQGNKSQLTIDVCFESDSARYIQQYSFQPSMDEGSVNFIKQAYLHLKTLPDFSGAEDC
jgi:hypothetical protein